MKEENFTDMAQTVALGHEVKARMLVDSVKESLATVRKDCLQDGVDDETIVVDVTAFGMTHHVLDKVEKATSRQQAFYAINTMAYALAMTINQINKTGVK